VVKAAPENIAATTMDAIRNNSERDCELVRRIAIR